MPKNLIINFVFAAVVFFACISLNWAQIPGESPFVVGQATNLVKILPREFGRRPLKYYATLVSFTTDKNGNVMTAQAIGGNPLTHSACVAAARKSTFLPSSVADETVSTRGQIIYEFFYTDSGFEISARTKYILLDFPASESKSEYAKTKLSADLILSLNRAASDESKSDWLNNLELKIGLTEKSSAAFDKLKAMKFVITENESKSDTVIGRISAENFDNLITSDFVWFVARYWKNMMPSSYVLNGKAVIFPKPDYPESAKSVRAQGLVPVQIMVSEDGDVISASAVGGNPLLRDAAVTAARRAKFTPQKLRGKTVKFAGILNYNFVAPNLTNEEKADDEQFKKKIKTKLSSSRRFD